VSTIPVRGLAERGLVLDAPPAELTLNAFSGGSNVRFRDGAARRASVLRQTRLFARPETRAVFNFEQGSGFDRLFAGSSGGLLREILADGTTTDRSPAGRTAIADTRQWTSAVLGDVLYAHFPTQVPAYFAGGAMTAFEPLPGWPSDQRARAIGASRDQVFAVNLTKGTTALPTTVAFSDYALYGLPPATWDPLGAGNANEITLASARSPLVGCLDLDGVMVVYGERQSWRFVFTGDTSNAAQNLWVNEPLSIDRGMIAPNGVAYVARRHYVFGTDDLYVHDGVTVESVADGRVRRWVFRHLDLKQAERCFVTVDPATDEVFFAFPSKDGGAVFPAVVGCNRAAVLNTRNGTWSLVDLPDVTASGAANFDPSLLWSAATGSWATFGGSWADFGDGFTRNAMFVAPTAETCRLLAVDEANTGRLNFVAAADVNPPARLERVGIDLDELGLPVNTYKIVSTILPQITTLVSNTSVRMQVGVSLYPQGPYTWGEWKTFDPETDYRVDFNRGGRYLGFRLEVVPPVDFEFGGMDLVIRPGGRR
jgi:hypothetical protein